MPPLRPVLASVSLTISSRILLKSWNFWPGMCRNSPHSSTLDSLSVVSKSSDTPFACAFGIAARLMSCRMSGRLVTIPVPRGRLSREASVAVQLYCPNQLSQPTSHVLQCSPALNFFHWTVTRPRRSEASRWGFGPSISSVLRTNTGPSEQNKHTPTVVNTSCSLFTKVIRPGSLTLILREGQ